MEQYFSIGQIVGTFGLNGEVVLKHNLGKKTSLKGLEVLFIEETKDKFIPYFITSSKIKNETEVYLGIEGFKYTQCKPLTFGISSIYLGDK